MTLVERVKGEYATWIASAAEAAVTALGRFNRQPLVVLAETGPNAFTMRMVAAPNQPSLAEWHLAIGEDGEGPPLSDDWTSALKGCRLEVNLRAARFLSRPLDLPRRASEFLDAMIRSQLDRLTPWTANDAVFSWTAPIDAGGDRIKINVIAAPKAKVMPLIQLAETWGVGSVVVNACLQADGAGTSGGTRILEKRLRGALDVAVIRNVLSTVLLSIAGVAALAFVAGDFIDGRLDAEQQALTSKIAERRAGLRLGAASTGDAAQNLLVRRKQTSPSAVIVLEALSEILPDDTYVTEMRIEKDKLQIVGVTQDAPALVKLIEQSPHFKRATFFAPTTRAANEPGERFHVEARLQPSFGPRT